jgi:orotate phosphoribosyltransferase
MLDGNNCRKAISGRPRVSMTGWQLCAACPPPGPARVGDTGRVTESLAQRIYRTCHLTGSFTLRSGLVSDEYFDKFLFESDPVLLRDVATAMASLLPADTEILAGMEMGGIPVVTVLSQVTGLPAVFVRKEPKTYGTCKLAEGVPVGGRRVVGVEDVVTRAGALLAGCLEMRRLGAVVDTAVCVIDRDQGGAENLRAEGIALRAALSRQELDAVASNGA